MIKKTFLLGGKKTSKAKSKENDNQGEKKSICNIDHYKG